METNSVALAPGETLTNPDPGSAKLRVILYASFLSSCPLPFPLCTEANNLRDPSAPTAETYPRPRLHHLTSAM